MSDARDANIDRLEEIVAYLDGELSPDESARVERRLASDESYRQQLQGIERAWKALDELPLTIVDDKFSKTTMEMAVQAATSEVKAKTLALPMQRRRRRWSSWLGAAAAAALGFLVVQLARQNPDRQLLADLPVIDNVDVYSQFERPDFMDFLVALRTEAGPDFQELGSRPAELADRVQRLQTISAAENRDDWLRQLNENDGAALRSKFNRFRELSLPVQDRLRTLHEQIVASPQAAELQQTMLAYDEWLSGLPPAKQFELRNMPADQRVRTVKTWAREMRDDAMFTLSDEELKQVMRNIRRPVEDLMKAAAKEMLKPEDDQRRGRAPTMMGPASWRTVLAKQFAAGVAVPGDFQKKLIEALPERTRSAFEALPPKEKVERFMAWMRQAEVQRGEVSQEQLERFFAEELSAETRAELLSLPPGEMQQTIRKLYRQQPGRGFGGAWSWGNRDGRDGRDGREGFGRPGGPGRPGPGGPGPGGPGPRGPRPEWDSGPPDRQGRGPGPPREGFGGPGERERQPPGEGFGGPGGPEGFGHPPRRPPHDGPPEDRGPEERGSDDEPPPG